MYKILETIYCGQGALLCCSGQPGAAQEGYLVNELSKFQLGVVSAAIVMIKQVIEGDTKVR